MLPTSPIWPENSIHQTTRPQSSNFPIGFLVGKKTEGLCPLVSFNSEQGLISVLSAPSLEPVTDDGIRSSLSPPPGLDWPHFYCNQTGVQTWDKNCHFLFPLSLLSFPACIFCPLDRNNRNTILNVLITPFGIFYAWFSRNFLSRHVLNMNNGRPRW